RVDGRAEGPALLGQRIFHPDRRVRDDRSLEDAFLLELLKAIAEHAIGDVGDGIAQRGEPAPRLEQHEDDRAGPAAADQLAGAVEAGAELRGMDGRAFHSRPSQVTATAARPQATTGQVVAIFYIVTVVDAAGASRG